MDMAKTKLSVEASVFGVDGDATTVAISRGTLKAWNAERDKKEEEKDKKIQQSRVPLSPTS
jgi:hypothetical protein